MSNYGNEILREIRNRHIESLTEAVDKEVVREIAIFVMNTCFLNEPVGSIYGE